MVLFVSVVLDGDVACIKGVFLFFLATAAGAAASSSVSVSRVIFVVVIVQIAWNTTNTL